MPTALITGITGQDGLYLAEHLLSRGYVVHGLIRGQHNPKKDLVRRLVPDVRLHDADLLDDSAVRATFLRVAPDEVYNLAAISFVQYTFANPYLTSQVTGLAVLRLLELVREQKAVRFYQASTSEMFGLATKGPQNESTPFHPRSPYAFSKTFAHHATVNYRESYGLFALGGILFNHESPRRSSEFVSRKITRGAASIRLGLQRRLELGNLDARRDWGAAPDYVRAMALMLAHDTPIDFVIGTGVTHTVREFAELAFKVVGLDWRQYVVSTPENMRPVEVPDLRADASLAKRVLGWEPTVSFEGLVTTMVEHDMRELEGAA